MDGDNRTTDRNLKYDKDVIVLQKKVKEIVKVSSAFLHTSEINIVEYLKNDRLINELYEGKKSKESFNLAENNIQFSSSRIDNIIEWLDTTWFGFKLEERLSIIYYLY